MAAVSILSGFDRLRQAEVSDWLAVGVAVTLPWSTTATGILIALWLIVLLVTLDVASLRRELKTAAGFLPVLLWVLAAVGMLWADVSFTERFAGLGKFHRLLVIPLLLMQFRSSERGIWALYGFFASVVALLLVSWGLALIPGLPWRGVREVGVPVKDYIFQSGNFVICAFAILGVAAELTRMQRWGPAAALVALAVLSFANLFFVITSRTALLDIPVLLLLLGWREFGWKGLLGTAFLACIVGVAVWLVSPYIQDRITRSVHELQAYRTSDAANPTGLHVEFLRKSLAFIETAPIIGHGTGSIPEQFRNAAVGETGAASELSANPHNQAFAVGIQLGLIGVAVLVAMWIAHLLLFRGGGLTAWFGTIVVVENIVSSPFNSHLFDFTAGWLYVFGVGVIGGMVLRQRASAPTSGRDAAMRRT
jgi:O-antigen ligase